MRIDHLKLHNFRGFEEFEIDLDPQLTVIAGINGTGKTSVLEGLAVAMGAWLYGFTQVETRYIEDHDVREARHDSGTLSTVEQQYPCVVEVQGHVNGVESWRIELTGANINAMQGDVASVIEAARNANDAVQAGERNQLPVVAYYGGSRFRSSHYLPASTRGLVSRLEGYKQCLDSTSDPSHFESWMRQVELVRIQRLSKQLRVLGDGAVSGTDLPNPIDLAVAAVVEGAQTLAYDLSRECLVLTMLDDSEQRYDFLSDGYRNLVSIAADLAWRAAQLNPHIEATAPRDVSGIVLIDEIELHLHPKWQREVLTRLTRAFPKVQFVVTTHSPIVLGSVEASKIRLLDGKGAVHRVGVAGGLTANDVLRDIMGVPERDDATRLALRELAVAIDRGNLDEAKARYDELYKQLGDTDGELKTLRWELTDLEFGDA